MSTSVSLYLLNYVPQGNTLENVAKELEHIISTGRYIFHLGECKEMEHSGGIKWQFYLKYMPYTITSDTSNNSLSSITSSTGDGHVVVGPYREEVLSLDSPTDSSMEHKNNEQINDFVRKLRFMDKEEGGEFVKQFLYFSQVGLKIFLSFLSFSYVLFP